jgi:hypothetical protein
LSHASNTRSGEALNWRVTRTVRSRSTIIAISFQSKSAKNV